MVGKGVNKEVEKMNKRRAKESGKKGLERMEEKRIRGKERRDEEQGKDVEETGQVGKVDHRHKRVEKGDVGKRVRSETMVISQLEHLQPLSDALITCSQSAGQLRADQQRRTLSEGTPGHS